MVCRPMLCSPRARIVIAELWSRSNTNPQFGHSCIRTLKSFSTIAPHLEHILLVLHGLTCTTLLPAFSALYEVKLTLQAASAMDLARQ
jgi:hypothetical protein